MAKTVEELEAELQELKSGNDALVKKNTELLDEMKKERRKNSENSGDLQKYYELQDKFDALKDEKTKLEHDLKKTAKTAEKLTAEKEALSGDLSKLIVDDGLADQSVKIGVKPEYYDAVKALLRGKVEIVDNKATADGKPLDEFMKEWATTDGKAFVTFPESGGGGSQGGNQGGGGQAPKEGTREYDIYRAQQLIDKE